MRDIAKTVERYEYYRIWKMKTDTIMYNFYKSATSYNYRFFIHDRCLGTTFGRVVSQNHIYFMV